MKYVIASGNKGKLKEFQTILKNYSIELVSAKELGIDMDEVIEDGESFEENALIKARYVYEALDAAYPVIADDSGLILNAYPDLLAIHSARFMEHASYAEKNQAILDKYQQEQEQDRSASFHTALVLIEKDGQEQRFQASIEGSIAQEILGDQGFGYDPIFIPKNYRESFAQMGDEKDRISHRAQALKKLEAYFEKEYLK